MSDLDDFFDMKQLGGIPRQDDLVWDKNQLQEDRMSEGKDNKQWQQELLDLITLMPDSQTQEIIDYIMQLRQIRAFRTRTQHDLSTLALATFGSGNEGKRMTGTVVRVMKDRKFGFIKGKDNVNYFFHKEDFNGHFDDLAADVSSRQLIEVQFTISESKRGPRAGEISRLDNGVIMG